MNDEELQKIINNHETRIANLERESNSPKEVKSEVTPKKNEWYKPGSTIDKVLNLVQENFFNEHRTISDIIVALKAKDYHLKSTDLTLPLRKIVRKGILQKTQKKADGTESKNWLYIKV